MSRGIHHQFTTMFMLALLLSLCLFFLPSTDLGSATSPYPKGFFLRIMGNASCCLFASPPPPGGGRFVSHERIVEFRNFRWEESSWWCSSCGAGWAVREPSQDQQWAGALQVAHHAGGQEEQFLTGDAGMCPDCKVYWSSAPQ